jgi:hypothetical protein
MKNRMLVVSMFLLVSVLSLQAQDKNFGIGIILGEPSGISGKLWLGSTNALDMAAAWSFKGNDHLLLQADYVWHSFDLIPVSSGKLPLYFGIGGRVLLADDPLIGVRVPIGLDYIFSNAPVDIFLEFVPILDLAPATDFDFGGGIGARYWF